MTNVFITDEYPIIRFGLRCMLESTPGFTVCGESHDATQLPEKLLESHTDLLLMGLNISSLVICDMVDDIRKKAPSLSILVLGMHKDTSTAITIINSGATGFIPKSSGTETVMNAILKCSSGGSYIHSDLGTPQLASSDSASHKRLSSREQEVFMLLAQGHSINNIAEGLRISPKTVSTHKFRILQKLELTTISEIVRYAIRHQLINA